MATLKSGCGQHNYTRALPYEFALASPLDTGHISKESQRPQGQWIIAMVLSPSYQSLGFRCPGQGATGLDLNFHPYVYEADSMPSKGQRKDFRVNKLILLILPMGSRYRPLWWSWGDSLHWFIPHSDNNYNISPIKVCSPWSVCFSLSTNLLQNDMGNTQTRYYKTIQYNMYIPSCLSVVYSAYRMRYCPVSQSHSALFLIISN